MGSLVAGQKHLEGVSVDEAHVIHSNVDAHHVIVPARRGTAAATAASPTAAELPGRNAVTTVPRTARVGGRELRLHELNGTE